MDHFPVEVWGKIFALACTDDGLTGRSLSLVSRYIHETSKPAKFRSISLKGIDQILKFISILEFTAPDLRSIQHLFVTDGESRKHVDEEVTDNDVAFKTTDLSEANHRKMRLEVRRQEQNATWNQAFPRLLKITEQTLQVLTVFCIVPRTYTLLPISLPNLIELTVYGPISSMWMDDTGVGAFPSLHHLHLGVFPVYPLTIFRTIKTLAPSLTHLRISGVEKEHELYHSLKEALGMDQQGQNNYELPSTVKQILFQPSNPPNSLRRPSHRRLTALLGDIRGLARRDTRLTVAETKGRWTAYEAEMDWLNTNGGGGVHCGDRTSQHDLHSYHRG